MFALFNRKRNDEIAVKSAPPPLFSLRHLPSSTPIAPTPTSNPEEQATLVSETVQKLDEVRQLVYSLPEIPAVNRQVLLDQIASTADNLRCLYFLDAIY